MFGITELVIVAIVVVLFFGASRLPGIGTGLGKGIDNFKKGVKGDQENDV